LEREEGKEDFFLGTCKKTIAFARKGPWDMPSLERKEKEIPWTFLPGLQEEGERRPSAACLAGKKRGEGENGTQPFISWKAAPLLSGARM